ncbi:MAG: PAS domain-containing sensor histidine kinase [bacterium]|nr:PAS domain-containing sensor histidine kinase [bacterium]
MDSTKKQRGDNRNPGISTEMESSSSSFIENALVGFYRTKYSDGRILMVNNALTKMFGFEDPEDMLAGENTIANHYVDDIRRNELLEILQRDGEVSNFESMMRRKDGSIFWVRFTARYFPEIGCIEGVVTDITGEKNALESLGQTSELFHALLNSIPDMIFIQDKAGRYTHINPAIEKLFNIPASEIIGKTNRDIHLHNNENRDSHDEDRVFNGEIIERDFTKTIDGRIHSFHMILYPINGADGSISGIFGIVHDITDTMQYLEEIKVKNIELLSAIEVKNKFISMVSHELRTPLVPIMGYSELLLDGTYGALPEAMREPLQTIYDRSEDLKKQIEDLLTISRIDQLAIRIIKKSVYVDQLVQDAVNSYRAIKSGKNIEFIIECEPCRIVADPERLNQVIHNLVGNAIKYSNDVVAITIRTGTRAGKGFIEVSDNGIGIAVEYLPYIFDRFYQVENLETRKHEGSGLGLSIVKEIIELMDGTIEVSSKPGVGTTFTIEFPLAEATT